MNLNLSRKDIVLGLAALVAAWFLGVALLYATVSLAVLVSCWYLRK